MKTHFLLLFIILSGYNHVIGQEILSPDQVDRYFPEQIEYYTSLINQKQESIDLEISKIKFQLDSIDAKKMWKKKKRKKKVALEEKLVDLNEIKSVLFEMNIGWSLKLDDLENSLNNKFLDEWEEGNCYKIIMTNGQKMMFNGDLVIDESETLSFNLVEPNFIMNEHYEELIPATTRWEKKKTDKNCLSANPDDCLVYCLVEVPAKYKTTKKKVKVGCDQGFKLNQEEETCKKKTILEGLHKNRSKFLFQKYFNSEILIASWKKVEC